MGATSSIVSQTPSQPIPQFTLKDLPAAIEESLYIHERFP